MSTDLTTPSVELLQRGRAPESAEMGQVGRGSHFPDRASTGPRSGERGDYSCSPPFHVRKGASTGPRSGERGDARELTYGATTTIPLQRGRAPESAEITSFHVSSPAYPSLQRGRAPESAEIRSHRSLHGGRTRASTGPRSGERGDVLDPSALLVEREPLQRGRAPESAEIIVLDPRKRTAPLRFNGAALRRARR